MYPDIDKLPVSNGIIHHPTYGDYQKTVKFEQGMSLYPGQEAESEVVLYVRPDECYDKCFVDFSGTSDPKEMEIEKFKTAIKVLAFRSMAIMPENEEDRLTSSEELELNACFETCRGENENE